MLFFVINAANHNMDVFVTWCDYTCPCVNIFNYDDIM